LVGRLELGEDRPGPDAGAEQFAFQVDNGLGRARARRTQDERDGAKGLITVLGCRDEARHHFDMPIDLGLSEIPRKSRTAHNAHFPPRSLWKWFCRADAM